MNQQTGSTMTIAEGSIRGSTLAVVITVEMCAVPLLLPFPVLALGKHFIPAPFAVAYLLLLTAALAWCVSRAARIGLTVDESGIVVRNFLRTYRAGWPQIGQLVDGRASDGCWALTVLLRNERAFTAGATAARPGSPGTLTTLQTAASSRGAPADPGG